MEALKTFVEEVFVGKKKGRPKDPANLGYFVSMKDQTRKNADNVCVLVIHYNFQNAKNKNLFRNGDSQDVENLERTFRVNRNCNFRSILSPEKGHLLQLLADQENLLQLFSCSEVPSVFVLYILSHGYRDGKIFTDHYQNEDPNDFISFTTTEIFDSLKMLTDFEECLKFINFGPCRGELTDAVFVANLKNIPFKNEHSCRITYRPLMRNMVVFFSTVETTKAKRDQSGTTFTRLTCQVLNSIEEDESLINVLATIQNESHKYVDIMENKYTGQTPEVKMFSQDRGFVISKITFPPKYSSCSTTDAMGVKNKRKREFFSWKSSSGENLRHRLAFLFSTEPNEWLKEIKRALSQNLNFETSERMLSGKPWTSVNEASRLGSNIGCIFLILFGQVSEQKDTNEVCVQVDSRETAVSEILREFIGPKNDQWIGKPKILFLVNQEASSFDDIGSLSQSKLEISATNHSGWLVLVLHGKATLEKLIEIFNGPELKKEKSLQELLASLLISESKENRDLLDSTLQYLLNFPDWPRSFVKLHFSVKNSQEYQEKHVCFDGLVEESARKNQIWLLSSVAGTGKTTILREMAFQLGKLNPELKILRVSLPRFSFSSLKRNVTEIEFLAKATHNPPEEIAKSIENKQCVVFLDGFDEIHPQNQEKMLKVIEALEKKQISVWIGTRPHALDTIRKRTSKAVLVKIAPLDIEQQIELLQQETGKSQDECESFIENFASKDILENPLHLSLVAQCGAEGNLYQIYDQVLRHKVELSLIRNGYDRNNKVKFQEELDIALERLQEIASCHIRGVEPTGYTREDLEEINCYGIATFENNKIIFIHQTFAEFLAAQHFLREIEDNNDCESQTSTEEIASVFYEQTFWWCRKFVDLFYSTVLNDEEKIEEHRASILPVMKLDPDRFLQLIARYGWVNIFKMVFPSIAFHGNQEGNFISVTKDKTLLVKAIDGAVEIAIMLLDTDLIGNDEELLIILPYLLKSVAESNATLFFEKLKTKHPRLPEMMRSRRFLIDAGVMAARKNCDEILELLLQSGVDVDCFNIIHGNALNCAIKNRAMKSVEVLLRHGAKIAIESSGDNWDPLMLAILENNLELVQFLLEENIGGPERNKDTFETNQLKAFQFSIQRGQKEIAKFLLLKNPSLKNSYEGCPLQYSAKHGYLSMCQWLVDEAGFDVNTLRPSGEPKDWSLHDNVCMDYFLILQKSNVDMTDERGKTALHCAAEHGYLELVQELIDAGANIRAVDNNGWNAFHFACKCNSDDQKEKVIRLLHSTDSHLAKEKTKNGETGLHILPKFSNSHLVEKTRFLVEDIGVDVRAEDNSGCTALHTAVQEGKDCVDYLMAKDINLEVKNKRGQTYLHLAAERGDLEALQFWVELGGDLDVVDDEGSTALHFAARGGHLQFVNGLLDHITKNAKNSVESVLEKRARANRCDNFGRTPLHFAASSKNVDLVQMLLDIDADLTLTDLEGKNAMHYAVNNERMLRFIIEKNGYLVKERLKNGNTILHLAIRSSYQTDKFLWLVEQCEIDLNVRNSEGETPLLLACKMRKWMIAKILLARNVDIHLQDKKGRTALHYAVYLESKSWDNDYKLEHTDAFDLMQELCKRGADLALTDNDGMNAFHHAITHFHMALFIHELNRDLVKQRLKNGDTTLHLAIKTISLLNDNVILILWLLEQDNVDLNARNALNETPLILACKEWHWNRKIAELLMSKNVDVNIRDNEGKSAQDYIETFGATQLLQGD
ncbi:uncharacterized protein LOC135935955 [Cloeon dipterum]|uniref:uncharacterized protein LOC135935955 n=1 Tax=Cloeon dipterum TaxID=197152 RepID=UPI003220851D